MVASRIRRALVLAALATATGLIAACGQDSGAGSQESPLSPEGISLAGARDPGLVSDQSSSQPLQPPQTRTFRDWFAVCDNGNDCMAFGRAAEGGVGWVRVSMPAGPQARPQVMAGFWPNEGDPATAPTVVTIDGRRMAAVETSPQEPEVTLADPTAAVAALVAGRQMTLSLGREVQPMVLTGATAALLWIDERQGRLDTVTALVRRGSQPASAVPPAPSLPAVRAAPAISQEGFGQYAPRLPATIEAMAETRECRADTEFSPDVQKEVQSARLDARTELWGVPCYVAAYNSGTRYFLTGPNGSGPRLLTLRGTGEPTDILTNASYSPDTRTLTQFSKGRGLGDCGVASSWVWTGTSFVLSEESVMENCWGAMADRWPTTWRTR